MEVCGGVEPEVELLLAVPFALREHIGVHYVRISGQVSQEFEVYLIVRSPLRRQLPQKTKSTFY